MKEQILNYIQKNSVARNLLQNRRNRIIFTAGVIMLLNVCYAIYNGILGLLYNSLWFFALYTYYIVLSVMRFATVYFERKNKSDITLSSEIFVMKFSGFMLIALSMVLLFSVYYSVNNEVAKSNGKIVMISIAAYTFCKVIIAIVNAVKIAKHKSPLLATIRNITCADAAASILSLQRSMLVSFKGMSNSDIILMNTLTGVFICLFVFML